MTENLPAKPFRFVDGEGIVYTACLLIVLILVRAWDAVQAVLAPEMFDAFVLYYTEPSRLAQLGPFLFALVVIGHYLSWMTNVLRQHQADELPTPGTAILHHLLPPFLFYRPFAILKSLMGEKANDAILSLWWGGLWGGIALYAFRFVFTLDNGAPASMVYWMVTLLMWLLFALSLACLAYACHTVTKHWNTD
jgi:hypothetical protein